MQGVMLRVAVPELVAVGVAKTAGRFAVGILVTPFVDDFNLLFLNPRFIVMWKYFLALCLIATLAPSVTRADTKAAKPPIAPPTLKFEGALTKVDQKVENLLGVDKQKVLRQAAEAAVLSDYCAAIDLDQNTFKQEFDALSDDGIKRKLADQRDLDTTVAMYFGVYVGVLVAEGTDRIAEFCGFAENALKEQKPISRFWIATNTSPTPPKP